MQASIEPQRRDIKHCLKSDDDKKARDRFIQSDMMLKAAEKALAEKLGKTGPGA
jgi:hypothetical protein